MKQATEQDLRMPHLRDADPADYEVREDGAVVRKDRWETGIRNIAGALGWSRTPYEIEDVVREVERLVEKAEAANAQ